MKTRKYSMWCVSPIAFSPQTHRDKAKELWDWLYQLETEKYDFTEQIKRKKYEVS